MATIKSTKVLDEKTIKEILKAWAKDKLHIDVSSIDVNLGSGGGEYGQSSYPELRNITLNYNETV